VTFVLEFIVIVQKGCCVPEHTPVQPVKRVFHHGIASMVTAVPARKLFPAGFVSTVADPVPAVLTVRVYQEMPAWVMVKGTPPMVSAAVCDPEPV